MQNIIWNGVALCCPNNWQIVVQESCRLLFEKKLQPMGELFWYQGRRSDIIKQLELRGWARSACQHGKNIQLQQGQDLLWLRQQGETIFALQFRSENDKNIIQMFESLRQEDTQYWHIDQLSLKIPEGWQLHRYNFALGSTTLQFSRGKEILSYLQLRNQQPKKERELLQALCLGQQLHWQKVDGYLEAQRTPSLLTQIMLRLNKKKPFVRARIARQQRSYQTVIIEGISEVEESFIDKIWRDYELKL